MKGCNFLNINFFGEIHFFFGKNEKLTFGSLE